MSDVLPDLVRRHRDGSAVGITSVCSVHPLVIEAAVRQARDDGGPLLLEATSNQVDQYGGYTGMRPADFRDLAYDIAARLGLPRERLVLGGDHLGPNRWRDLGADAAMDRAEVQVAAYVEAGFDKIHLDCSMACAGDPEPPPDELVAERAARLARVAEKAAEQTGTRPVYVIGTEVPVPGGARETIESLAPTSPAAAEATIAAHRDAFRTAGAEDAWERVIGLVVQPGVEFDHHKVIDYDRAKATRLSGALAEQPHFVFEAHSTDYQTPGALKALVEDHFAILKVGPGVTFALREALWALDAIEREWIGEARASGLRRIALERMNADPRNWAKYYHATGAELQFDLQYSLSDRIRYYWPDPQIVAAQEVLFGNLAADPPPLALISQYLPHAYAAVRETGLAPEPARLVIAHIAATLEAYRAACTPEPESAYA